MMGFMSSLLGSSHVVTILQVDRGVHIPPFALRNQRVGKGFLEPDEFWNTWGGGGDICLAKGKKRRKEVFF